MYFIPCFKSISALNWEHTCIPVLNQAIHTNIWITFIYNCNGRNKMLK